MGQSISASNDTIQFNDSWANGDLTLVPNSVKIESVQLEPKLSEIAIVGTPTTVTTPTITDNATGLNFTLSGLTGTNAYKVTYITEVARTPKTEVENFENKVAVTPTISGNTLNWDADATVDLEYGKPLEKTYTGDKYEAEWQVAYNYIGNQIQGKVLKDSLGTNSLHQYDADSIKLYEVNGTEETEVDPSFATIDTDLVEKSITVTFNEPTTKPYILKYTTKATMDVIHGENGAAPAPVANTVEVGTPGEGYDYRVSTDLYMGKV